MVRTGNVKIPGALTAVDDNHIVAYTGDIYDPLWSMTQEDLNEQVFHKIRTGQPIELRQSWGNILGDIANQTDLQELLNNIATNCDSSWGNIKGNLEDQTDLNDRLVYDKQELMEKMKVYLSNTVDYFQGIPIYNQDLLDRYREDDMFPETYISIPNATDLSTVTKNMVYKTTGQNTYLDTIFGALRALQAEVAKLKNTFTYGLQSYTGTDTAMGTIASEDIGDVDGSEPLWAVEEDSLSILDELYFNSGCILNEDNGTVDVTSGIDAVVSGTTYYEDISKAIESAEDPKIIFYITTSSEDYKGKNVVLELEDLDYTPYKIDINAISKVANVKGYNIQIIHSRVINGKGFNFIWLSISNSRNNDILAEGYYNFETGALQQNPYELENILIFKKLYFTDLTIHKLKIYSKKLNFSREVIPTTPDDSPYKYKVAHLTIRAVPTYKVAVSLTDYLLENELIYVEDTGILYIKNDYKIKAISGGGTPGGGDNGDNDDDTTMNANELLQVLQEKGIIQTEQDSNGNYKFLGLSPLDGITLVHEATQKEFNISVDAEGNIITSKINKETIEDILKTIHGHTNNPTRGFIGNLLGGKENSVFTKNLGLNSDRLKIGAVYAPSEEVTVHGCTHAYIELENTSDKDIPLKGCFINFVTGSKSASGPDNNFVNKTLELTGVIPKQSTYLIRGKRYTEDNQANTIIKVATYDQEWYDGNQLIDLKTKEHTNIILTYGNVISEKGEYKISGLAGRTTIACMSIPTDDITGIDTSKYPKVYADCFIDGIAIGGSVMVGTSTTANQLVPVDKAFSNPKKSCIYKNTFELDPANQAYQSLNTQDSSRYRNNNAADLQVLLLDKETISFPKTKEEYPISKFTPKASFEHKNISTDKTQMNMEKPNMVTCSFGINIHTTRCFNWVSAGSFDEYLWIRKKGETSWQRFQSYTNVTSMNTEGSAYPHRKEFSVEINNIIYARITNKFPGCELQYTAHKCILELSESAPYTVTEYEYVVGRSKLNGTFDEEHSSEIYTFTVYPETYTPKVYHITDQQGFHWVEYQVWAAAAQSINAIIAQDQEADNIIPILINTGDMTQSGSRINEWIDYHTGGKCLFNHLEQMNVVGNNDLCSTDPTILGTGDDAGKSNGYYFHVFYCYEVDTTVEVKTEEDVPTNVQALPIINGKYVPSLYHFGNKSYDFLMINSEITQTNCKEYFKLINGANTINAYTGYEISTASPAYRGVLFTPLYRIIYHYLNKAKEANKVITAACHEMPFTVVTNLNLENGAHNYNRSINCTKKDNNYTPATSIVGSHLNIIGSEDTKGIYWFSRLLEYFKVKICIGGHKHTYAITRPLMENYKYTDNSGNTKYSAKDGPMTMKDTLKDDSAEFVFTQEDFKQINGTLPEDIFIDNTTMFNTTKLPLSVKLTNDYIKYVPSVNVIKTGDVVEPLYALDALPSNASPVTYCMCQATGYKLFSNKELPSVLQTFSAIIPKSNVDDSGKYTAAASQKQPMFGMVEYAADINYYIVRINNITNSTNLYNQSSYSSEGIKLEYIVSVTGEQPSAKAKMLDKDENPMYGWVDTNKKAITIIK